eukprot:TRINITY_DN66595_c0_g1_i1.p1 TRINITY_DN66595_c0_g1~~TRINITY_DN66595_c0_g1_i1.p1  ORF type:complete len:174 (-),score=19.02 TRINITY_DN66595_c0_g1_i1:182-703(-)
MCPSLEKTGRCTVPACRYAHRPEDVQKKGRQGSKQLVPASGSRLPSAVGQPPKNSATCSSDPDSKCTKASSSSVGDELLSVSDVYSSEVEQPMDERSSKDVKTLVDGKRLPWLDCVLAVKNTFIHIELAETARMSALRRVRSVPHSIGRLLERGCASARFERVVVDEAMSFSL